MKNILFLLSLAATLFACQNTPQAKHDHPELEKAAQQNAAAAKSDTLHVHVFACPMHPEITGKEGDKCPKCGMALEHSNCPNNFFIIGLWLK